MTQSTVQQQPGQYKPQRQLKFIGSSGQGVLAQAGVASWSTGTEGRKTEQEENSTSGRKKSMSKGEAAKMRMNYFFGCEKPTGGAKGSCWRRMRDKVR